MVCDPYSWWETSLTLIQKLHASSFRITFSSLIRRCWLKVEWSEFHLVVFFRCSIAWLCEAVNVSSVDQICCWDEEVCEYAQTILMAIFQVHQSYPVFTGQSFSSWVSSWDRSKLFIPFLTQCHHYADVFFSCFFCSIIHCIMMS